MNLIKTLPMLLVTMSIGLAHVADTVTLAPQHTMRQAQLDLQEDEINRIVSARINGYERPYIFF